MSDCRAVPVLFSDATGISRCRNTFSLPSRVEQSVAHLTHEPEVPVRYLDRSYTFVSPPVDSRRAAVSYWRKYVHEVLINGLGGVSLPRKMWLD